MAFIQIVLIIIEKSFCKHSILLLNFKGSYSKSKSKFEINSSMSVIITHQLLTSASNNHNWGQRGLSKDDMPHVK